MNEKVKSIVRSVEAGVFYGYITEFDDATRTCKMDEARNLFYWSGAASLNQLAAEGVKNPESCKFSMPVNGLKILNVCEVLTCTKGAEKNLDEVPVWKI